MSKERQQEAVRQQQQLAAAQAEAEGLRAKLEAALSRRRAVEAEVGKAAVSNWAGQCEPLPPLASQGSGAAAEATCWPAQRQSQSCHQMS